MAERVVIVGGGVIGLLAAYELCRRGAAVTLLDKGELGAACSSGNAGWITPALSGPVPAPGLVSTSLRWMLKRDSPLYIRPTAALRLAPWLLAFWRRCNTRDYQSGLEATAELGRSTMRLYDALAANGVEFEMHRDGILFACLHRPALDHILEDLNEMRAFGYDSPAILDPGELSEFDPGISGPLAAAVWVKEERHVRPESLTMAVARWLADHGADLRPRTEVVGLRRAGARVTAVETTAGEIAAEQVLLATGAWLGRTARLAGLRIPMQAGKGYHVTVDNPELRLRHPLYLVDERVAVSPFDGALRISGTMELSGINTTLDQRRAAALRRGANRYIPGWQRGAAERAWVGMRPMLPDGLPVIGRAPGYDNLFLAGGHAMLGVTLGPPTASIIAELMTRGCVDADLAPFDPRRFGRQPGKD